MFTHVPYTPSRARATDCKSSNAPVVAEKDQCRWLSGREPLACELTVHLPLTHCIPRLTSSRARLLSGSLVRARTAYGVGVPSAHGSSSLSMTASPCAPVAPMTRMSFLFWMFALESMRNVESTRIPEECFATPGPFPHASFIFDSLPLSNLRLRAAMHQPTLSRRACSVPQRRLSSHSRMVRRSAALHLERGRDAPHARRQKRLLPIGSLLPYDMYMGRRPWSGLPT